MALPVLHSQLGQCVGLETLRVTEGWSDRFWLYSIRRAKEHADGFEL
jgi:hypothetical protein